MNIKSKVTATTLAMLITIGGASTAFAGSNGGENGGDNTNGRHRPKVEQICAHKDEIVTRLTEVQTKLTQRIARLTELSKKASDAGHAEWSAKIDARIAKLQTKLDRVGARLAGAPAWIAAHCG